MIKLLLFFTLTLVSVSATAQVSMYKLDPLKSEMVFNRKQEVFVFEFIATNFSRAHKQFEPMFKFPLSEENEINAKSDLSKYLVNKKMVVKMKPGESKKIKLEFKIPASVTGSLYLRYGLKEVNAANVNGMRFKVGELGLLGVSVNGTVAQRIELTEEVYTPSKGQLNANFTFKNTGNSYIKKMKGEFLLISKGKVVLKKEVVPVDDLFFPQGLTKKMNMFARHKLPAGQYEGKFIISDNEGTFAEVIPVKVNLK